jgi:hypothetical protein
MRRLITILLFVLCIACNKNERESNLELFATSDYEYCGDEETCVLTQGRRDNKNVYSCKDSKACTDQGCNCLFWKRKKVKEGDQEVPKWEKIDGSQEDEDSDYTYGCWCMKPKAGGNQ